MKKIILAIFMLILFVPSVLANMDINCDNDTSSETIIIREEENVLFTYELTNTNNTSVAYYIITPEKEGWNFSLNNRDGNIDSLSMVEVTLTITPPDYKLEDTIETNIKFHLIENGTTTTQTLPINIELIRPGKILGMFDNPLPSDLNNQYSTFLINILCWLGISLLLVFAILPLLKKVTKKTKTEADDIVFDTIKKPVLGIIILYGIVSSLAILSFISADLLSNLFLIYGLVLLLTSGYIAYKLFHNLVIYYGKKWTEKTETEFDDMLINVVEKIGNIIIFACIGLSLLSYFGIDITILLAGMGVLGIVIGFAAQDTLSNLFSGIQLIIDAPFRIGDYIIFEGGEGVYEVKDVGLRSTKLYDLFEHTIVIIPNKILADNKIINLKRPDTAIKTSVAVGVAYGTDVKKVENILMEIGLSHQHVLKTEKRKPFVRFSDFGDSSLDFVLYVWIDDILNQWATKSELRDMISEKFTQENIEIPFPHRDVWIKKE